MHDQDQYPQLDWYDDFVPVSQRFDDPYFSFAGGLAETRYVFLAGNDLYTRLRCGFHVAELGFGTGLNLLALAQIVTVPVRFTSFEAFPVSLDQIARAHAAFPELKILTEQLQAGYEQRRFQLGQVKAEIIIGDARDTLPLWQGRADAWFLDGFSPAKNPELWGEDLMKQVGLHTAKGGTFATYSAAGHIRRALDAGGFNVSRISGYAGKRHMSRGILR